MRETTFNDKQSREERARDRGRGGRGRGVARRAKEKVPGPSELARGSSVDGRY